jgi:enhancing lycopene biosynthesis protein 2
MVRIGLLLSGCGFYDGTDVAEAVLAAWALDKLGSRALYFAPGGGTGEVVDHASGLLVEGERRSVLAESARIARGRIAPLSEARPSSLEGLIIPGGEGIARALMTGAAEPGRKREIATEVAPFLRGMLESGKPIGTISLGATLTATALGLPLDEDPFSTPATEIRVDEERGIVWTPGHLASSRLSEIAVGIERMAEEVVRRASRRAGSGS